MKHGDDKRHGARGMKLNTSTGQVGGHTSTVPENTTPLIVPLPTRAGRCIHHGHVLKGGEGGHRIREGPYQVVEPCTELPTTSINQPINQSIIQTHKTKQPSARTCPTTPVNSLAAIQGQPGQPKTYLRFDRRDMDRGIVPTSSHASKFSILCVYQATHGWTPAYHKRAKQSDPHNKIAISAGTGA